MGYIGRSDMQVGVGRSGGEVGSARQVGQAVESDSWDLGAARGVDGANARS